MSITNNNTIARVAAVVAGLGLVAMSFAPFAQADTTSDLQAQINSLLATIASLQAQLGGSTTMSATFNTDLTIGSTGSDVTALQTWLISKGYSIPAGATGFFGTQTQAAVAAFQAANGITPAVGFFGPITRAKVNSMTTTTTGTGTGTTTGTGSVSLSGGEATLSNYKINNQGGTINQGGTNIPVANPQFDVSGGDVNVQRVDLEFQAGITSPASTHPWQYIKDITVWNGSTKLATVDASQQSDWSDNVADATHAVSAADFYTITVAGFNDVVRNGSTANLSIEVDAQSTIDSNNATQTFTVDIPSQGIRAVDPTGIQQYIGGTTTAKLTVNAAVNGTLTLSEASDDPSSGVLVAKTTQSTDNFNVFNFKVGNTDNVDTQLDSVVLKVATTSSAGPDKNISTIVRVANLSIGGQNYSGTINSNNTITFNQMNAVVPANGSTEGTLTIGLFSQTGNFATGQTLVFSLPAANVTAENATNGNSTSNISGTATGNAQTLAVTGGISVAGTHANNTAVQTYNSQNPQNSYGTFIIKYNVTAIGNDVFIPRAIDTTANTSGHTATTTPYLGAQINMNMGSASTTNSVVTTSLSSTAAVDTNPLFYVVHAGGTETFTATVTVNPIGNATDLNSIQAGLDMVQFSTTDTNLNSLSTLNVDNTDPQFNTDPLVIAG